MLVDTSAFKSMHHRLVDALGDCVLTWQVDCIPYFGIADVKSNLKVAMLCGAAVSVPERRTKTLNFDANTSFSCNIASCL